METTGAESRIKELERRFKNMQIAARKELEGKKDAVELVKDELTAIPGQREHLTTFKAIARRKRPFKNLTEFFTHLTYHCWSFIEYQPLEHLIENTCSEKLKERVKIYARDVQIYQENTTISEFLTYRGYLAKKRRIPESFKKFKTEHNIDPETYTLAELERLRKKTCTHVKLSDFALQILTITTNCIIVEWMIPEEIVEILSLFYSSEVGQELLHHHQVESIVIDDKSLHSWVLLATIKSGDYEKATSILREKYTDLDLNCQDYDNGRTVLFYTATSGILDLVEKLLEQGADLNIVDMEGKSSLMVAVEGEHIEVVKLFLKLDYQCDTNIQEKTLGWTALHFACAKGREDIIELLLNPVLQTDAQLVDNNGRTAIQIAQENRHDKVVDLLSSEVDFDPALSGAVTEPGEPDDRVEESKQVSARSSRPRIRKFLLRIPWPQRKKRNKLVEAAKIGSEAEVRKLLDEGEDPDSHEDNKSKWTSLLYASHNGHLGVVRLLLEKKANPNWRSADEGYTALNLAGYKGFVEILELLLQYGAEVNATTEVTKQTALQRVCLYTPARYKRAKEPPSDRRCEVIQLLLSAGADIKILDEQNRTPLIASSRSGFPGIVKILLEKIKEFPEDEKQKYLDHAMRHSWTALMEASEAGHTEIVRMLLDAGATLKQEKKDKVTALHIAVHHKHTAVVQELVRQAEKEVLNARDHYGMTPLILATKAKNEEIISILLNAGADLDLQTEDADKMTALMYAVKHGARDVIKILTRHKADLFITDAKKRTARDMAKSSAIKRYLYELEQEQRQLAGYQYKQLPDEGKEGSVTGNQTQSAGAQQHELPTATITVKGKKPELYELQLLEFDKGKESTTLRIMEKVIPKWKQVALALGFNTPRIEAIEMGALRRPEDASLVMFTDWLAGGHDLRPPTWDVLIQSLRTANLPEIVDLLKFIEIGVRDASADEAPMTVDTKTQVALTFATPDAFSGSVRVKSAKCESESTTKSGNSELTGSLQTKQVADDYMKCPVCLNVHVDPCTLPCGHTFCQLCLARMWKSNQKICPVCKETWKPFPAISYDYRRNIESAHGCEVEQLRKEYSLEDKELIDEAKRIFNLKSESPAQEVEEKGQLPDKIDVWRLPGVEECDETSVAVHSSQGQLVEWNGLKLHIHAGSLPEGLQQCTIFIKASLAGEYEIPKNTSLVSAFFWLRCEPQCTFTKPITVEIQHCSTKQDLSKLKIVRAFCSQKLLPYKFKPLEGGRFDADTSYGAIEVTHFSGFGATENNPDSKKLYYNQLFYCSNHSQQRHDIHIIYTLNTEPHINDVCAKYPEEQGYNPGCHQVVELDKAFIEVVLDKRKWTEVMDGQWKIYPIKPSLTKAELDDFQLGRGIPNCLLEARPLCGDSPQLLHGITLTGIKEPYDELTLRLYNNRPPRRGGHGPFKLTVAILVLLVLCAVGYYAVSTLHNHHTFRNDEVQNLNDLIQAVKDIGNWQALCTNLGVDDGVMETLVHSTTTAYIKKADCLRAYFNDGKANWGDVVKAVTMHPISNKRVAKQIAKTYGLDYNSIVKEEL